LPEEKAQSLRALDALNFCNAGIQTGLGPFMSIFYTAVRHWHPGQIGILIACQSFAGILTQPIIGKFVDDSHNKRLLTAIAAIAVSLGAVGIALFPSFGVQIAVQLVIGLAVTIFPAATAAFALGMAGEKDLSGRVARNETLTHTGNMVFAIVAGLISVFLALQGIFYAAAVFAAGMAGSVLFIKSDDVDHEAARGGQQDKEGEGDQPERKGFRDLIKDKRILTFTLAVVLFNVSNAATLPLVGEILSKDKAGAKNAGWQIAACVFVAEIVMIGVAAISGKKADNWGRKPLFLIAFAFLAVRNGLTVVTHNPGYLISLQALDGVAAALYGVLLTLVTADLAKGTGRFNFLQGAIQSSMGLGAFLSNLAFGFVAKTLGFNVSFLGLAGVAVAGGLLYQFRMPETKPDQEQEKKQEEPEHAEAK
jgi:MFS family permease